MPSDDDHVADHDHMIGEEDPFVVGELAGWNGDHLGLRFEPLNGGVPSTTFVANTTQ